MSRILREVRVGRECQEWTLGVKEWTLRDKEWIFGEKEGGQREQRGRTESIKIR